ncbi:UDP-N-acetylglucosamine pyrophosphorylase [Anaerosoma tenue]|uniref:UDP-N-acetylglucosamine pyrophosphorylase n=1 Tax=Anaerosoma tenue TaxID=2933588 RepID=UPI0022608A4D|nr:UDP-N-acetylglucosamine pyrophosphorylase [Anaerosoma tenue]MCK8115608.1 UDP-N-acetylglucosamine pyrophosphorylase [Anaerosoma tenue]
MDPQPRAHENVVRLIEKGVDVRAPLSVDVGDEVDVTRISGDGVTIYPGCRIYGERTVISEGCTLGAEGPVTLDDCRLGPRVALKGGYFKRSVFLEKANMGLGAQVREGCLLEEEANGAHCVGLKQTILFPFVTLGSLINFCDCFMAGGTSRKDHSEVGSSYVHFNYTPDGDKTTASLFGDVPRGVMLDRPPIFLGGQGGAVGPVRVGYGTVVAAGSVLRADVGDDRLVFASPPESHERQHQPLSYRNLSRVVANNLAYLANLVALEHWYREVRAPFFERQALGDLVYEGALDMLALAKTERTKRLSAMAAKVPRSTEAAEQFAAGVDRIATDFMEARGIADASAFLRHIEGSWKAGNYLETMQGLSPEAKAAGVQWLEEIVARLTQEAADILPAMDLPSA